MQLCKTLMMAGLVATVGAASALAADPFGTWVRASTGAKLEFYDCSGKLCVKVAEVKDQSKKDAVGKVIVNGAVKSGDNVWKGDLLNLDDGKTYSGHFTLESPTALVLKGCALAGLVCKSETLQKAP